MVAGVPTPSPSSAPNHQSVASTIKSPSEVAKTVVAESEPRFPMTRIVVAIGAPVNFVTTSTTRANPSLPSVGTVISRWTLRPDSVASVVRVRPPSPVMPAEPNVDA